MYKHSRRLAYYTYTYNDLFSCYRLVISQIKYINLEAVWYGIVGFNVPLDTL